MNQYELHFDGKTYDHPKDSGRLSKQLYAVKDLMIDGQWRTLFEIAQTIDAPEASVSARLRDLRKPRFGYWTVNRRRRTQGTWEYQLTDPYHQM